MSSAVLVDEVDPLIGRVFASRYKIEELLGAGAMGTVYRARHVKVGRPFAVKILHERLLDEKLRKRFDREAELAGKLHHINVVGVVDVGETEDGIHFMVMEYADGTPLGALVNGPMASARVIDLVKQLCDGLQHAHEHGMIHRDFKPDNVIVERDRFGDERPRIVDFGIAILRDEAEVPDRADRLTTAGLVLGTPHYMAPEHAMGGGIDHRIDLFALGVICYELVTGQLPYDGDGVDVARANLLTATPPMGVRVPGVAVDPLLEAFTRALMQKDPDDRPQSAKEARRLLELITMDRGAAAVALGIEQPADEPSGAVAASALATPTDGTTPTPADRTTPSPAAPISTPITRAVTAAEQKGDSALQEGLSRARQPQRATSVLPTTRRSLAIGLGVGLVASVVVVLMIATRGGGSSGSAPLAAAPAVATLTMDAGIAPVTDPVPSAVDGAPGLATVIPADAAVSTVAPDAGKPQTRPAKPSQLQPPRAPKPTKPTVPTQLTKPTQPAVADTSGAGVANLYGAVGRELKALDTRRGSAATSTLWPRYLGIRINDAMAAPDKRIAAHRTLSTLRKEIAAQR